MSFVACAILRLHTGVIIDCLVLRVSTNKLQYKSYNVLAKREECGIVWQL